MQRISRAVRVSAFLLACAVCAGPASAGGGFMKFDGVVVPGGSGQIEIQSFSWGPRQSTSTDGAHHGGGHGTGKVAVHDISISKQATGRASSDITMKGSKIGENAPRGTGANQMTMDDTAGTEKARRRTRTVDANETITIHGGRTEGDPDRPLIAGTVPTPYNPKEFSLRKDTMGLAPQAREHDKRTTWVERSAPEPKGSVWIRVATPWAACRAGTRYPGMELGDGTASYRLSDVVVTGCGADGVRLDYARVTVRGWDPEKKEE